MSTIQLPEGFQYVGAALTGTFFVLAYQTILVGRARKRAGIAYPQLYAEKAEAENNREAWMFNCTQRAHQNTLETVNMVIAGTILVGLKYPIIAASLCGVWITARIGYTIGYTTGDPAKRVNAISFAGAIAMISLIAGSAFVWGRAAVTGVF